MPLALVGPRLLAGTGLARGIEVVQRFIPFGLAGLWGALPAEWS